MQENEKIDNEISASLNEMILEKEVENSMKSPYPIINNITAETKPKKIKRNSLIQKLSYDWYI